MKETINKEYSPDYVKGLFDRMASTYGILNYISSFGFTEIWRKRCVSNIRITNNKSLIGYDLMSGMGECFYLIKNKFPNSQLTGIDISEIMSQKAHENNIKKNKILKVELLQEDIFHNSLESNKADFITSAFGLKTFNAIQLELLSKEVFKLLKRKGQFSFIEISVPSNKILKTIFIFYLQKVIPLIGKYFVDDLESYKMLGYYTENFKNSMYFKQKLEEQGLEVQYVEHFFGCATGVKGIKK